MPSDLDRLRDYELVAIAGLEAIEIILCPFEHEPMRFGTESTMTRSRRQAAVDRLPGQQSGRHKATRRSSVLRWSDSG